jgi:hypothetical protein
MIPPTGSGATRTADRIEHLVTETCMQPAERIHPGEDEALAAHALDVGMHERAELEQPVALRRRRDACEHAAGAERAVGGALAGCHIARRGTCRIVYASMKPSASSISSTSVTATTFTTSRTPETRRVVLV